MAWPNDDFVHSAYGKTRTLLGPIAVIPGKPEASLWPTGAVLGGFVNCFIFPLHVAIGITQISVGTANLQFASECTAAGLSIPTWLIVHGAIKIAWPIGVGMCFALFGGSSAGLG